MSQSRHKETKQAADGQEGESKEQSSDAHPRDSSQNKTDNKTFAVTNVQQDGLTSSLLETSEDEEAQRRREAELAKKKVKGLSERQLDLDINVTLTETSTCEMLYIPSKVVAGDGDEALAVKE